MGNRKIDDEVLERLKYILEKNPLIKEVKFNESETYIEVWLEEIEDTKSHYGGDFGRAIREDIDRILHKEFNLEIGGVGELSNWNAFIKAQKEFESENPKPIDPSNNLSWKNRSYYDRTKGKGAKEMEAYKAALKNWLEDLKAYVPPKYFPGFRFDVQEAGTSDKIHSFYQGTKYWGD